MRFERAAATRPHLTVRLRQVLRDFNLKGWKVRPNGWLPWNCLLPHGPHRTDRMLRLTAVAVATFAVAVSSARAASVPDPPKAVSTALRRAFGASQLRTAECVAWWESRYRLDVVSATGDYGLMQIHRAAWRWAFLIPGRIFTLDWNVRVAHVVYVKTRRQRGNGWLAWSTYRTRCA